MKFICRFCRKLTEIAVIESHVSCGHCQQVIEVPKSPFSSGAVFADDYIIQQQIGIGGMGLVYKAHQISLERSVAVKVLKDHYCKDKRFIKDFIHEARAAARLRHPGIVQAYAVGHDQGHYFIAMEYIQGSTAAEKLEQGSICEKECIDIAIQITHALEYAWKQEKLLHRDIKPDNIILDGKRAKLMDLGLACAYEDTSNDSDEVLGTPQYISPEQITGTLMDFRGDQYSLGASLYHMACDRYPYNGKNATDTTLMHLSSTLVPPIQINRSLSVQFSKLICKMMHADPRCRFQNNQLLIEALEECLEAEKTLVKRKIKATRVKTLPEKVTKEKSTRKTAKTRRRQEEHVSTALTLPGFNKKAPLFIASAAVLALFCIVSMVIIFS